MPIKFSVRNCLNFSLLVLNFFFVSIFGREYVFEVEPSGNKFAVITNIPKEGASAAQHAGDNPVPAVRYENITGSVRFMINEQDRNIEAVIDAGGHIDIKQLNTTDSLKIKNDGNIHFVDGGKPQIVGALTLACQKVRNSANLTVAGIDGTVSGDFINDGTLTFASLLADNKSSFIKCQNFENNNTIGITKYLCCDCDFFINASKITGDGNLFIKPVQLVNDTTASIVLPKGKLSIVANSQRAETKTCEQDKSEFLCQPGECLHYFFSEKYPPNFASPDKESPRKTMQIQSLKRRQRGDNPQKRGRDKLHHATKKSCHDCFLSGTINVGTISLQSVVVELQGNITTELDCFLQSSDYLRNSGTVYSKGNLEITNTQNFFNDVKSSMSALKKLKIGSKEIPSQRIVNIGAVLAGGEIEITANRLVNARFEEKKTREEVDLATDENGLETKEYNIKSIEESPIGYIIARDGNISISTEWFLQDACVMVADNDIEVVFTHSFKNMARELEHENHVIEEEENCCGDRFKRHTGNIDNVIYEPSSIAAAGEVRLTVGDKAPGVPSFRNTGTIQGQRVLTLQATKKVMIINGFDSKLINAHFFKTRALSAFPPLPSIIDFQRYLIPGEHEHMRENLCYYHTHPLYHEKKPFKEIQEVALTGGSIKQSMPFLISPLIEGMCLEFALHEHAGKLRMSGFKQRNEQLHALQERGRVYAIAHGTLTLISDIPVSTELESEEKPHFSKPTLPLLPSQVTGVPIPASKPIVHPIRSVDDKPPVQPKSRCLKPPCPMPASQLLYSYPCASSSSNKPQLCPGVLTREQMNKYEAEERERKKIILTAEEREKYLNLIKSVRGSISPEEYVRRLNVLTAGTHIMRLEQTDIDIANVSFIYYKAKKHDGIIYLHPYFHPSTYEFATLRRVDGSMESDEMNVDASESTFKNYGFIKAAKGLNVKVGSFLSERPVQERFDGIYKIIEAKPGGDYQGATVDITAVEGDSTLKGGTGTATRGDHKLKSEKGSVKIIDAQVTNPNAVDGSTMPLPAQMLAAGNNNIGAAQQVLIQNSQAIAGANTHINGTTGVTVATVATAYNSTQSDGHTRQQVAVAQAGVASGESTYVKTDGTAMFQGAALAAKDTFSSNAKDGNILKPAVVETRQTDTTIECGLLGCKSEQTVQTEQHLIQTTIDAENVVLTSDLDNVLEAVIINAGQLVHIVSGRNSIFRGTQTNSSTEQSGWGFGISFFGSDALQSAFDGNLKEAAIELTASDPLAAAIMNLSVMKDKVDVIAGTEYVGIEALRLLVQRSKQSKGLKGLGITEGQRLKILNAAGKFSPQFTFSLGWHTAGQSKIETVSSKINAMKFVVESGNDTVFQDGTQVTAQESRVTSQRVVFGPAVNIRHSRNGGGGIDIFFGGDGFGLGAHANDEKNKAIYYTNVLFNVASQSWEAKEINGNGVCLRGKLGHFDVKKMRLASVQNIEKRSNKGGGGSASTSGAFSAFLNYDEIDNAWISERACFEFDKATGHIEELAQVASDAKVGGQSTLKINKVTGQNLHDHNNSRGFSAAAGVAPGDSVPVAVDVDRKNDHDGGTQQSYLSRNVKTDQAESVVRDADKKYVADKSIHSHWRVVVPIINPERVKQAIHDLKAMHSNEKKATISEFEKNEEALLGDDHDKNEFDSALENPRDEPTSEQAADKQANREDQLQKNTEQSSDQSEEKTSTDNGDSEPDNADDADADTEVAEMQKHTFKTAEGKKVNVVVSRDRDSGKTLQPDKPFTLLDIAKDPTGIVTMLYGKGDSIIKIKSDVATLFDVVRQNEASINYQLQQSGKPDQIITHPTDEHRILKIAASIILDFVPVVGTAKAAYEVISGYDAITGEKLAWWHRTLAGVAVVVPFVVYAVKTVRAGKVIVETTKVVKDFGKVEKTVEAASDLGKVEKAAEVTNRYVGELIQVNKADAAADALAKKIGGQSRVRFSTDPLAREFDAISKEYIAQTKPALQTVNKNVRSQMKATFEAAKETGKKVYYHFEGYPEQSVINKLNEYSKRYGIDVVIDTNPLMK